MNRTYLLLHNVDCCRTEDERAEDLGAPSCSEDMQGLSDGQVSK